MRQSITALTAALALAATGLTACSSPEQTAEKHKLEAIRAAQMLCLKQIDPTSGWQILGDNDVQENVKYGRGMGKNYDFYSLERGQISSGGDVYDYTTNDEASAHFKAIKTCMKGPDAPTPSPGN